MDKKNKLLTWNRNFLMCFILGLSLLAVYWQVSSHSFLNYDDDIYITENIQVSQGLNLKGVAWAFSSFSASNWHPLTWISHMLDCQLFGLNSGAHHLVNLLIHAINTLLLFLLLKNGTGYFWRSWLVAALFALHPLHVESVAWAAERKDLLCAFWGMLAIWSYARYVKDNAFCYYAASIIFFICGLLSKPMLVSLSIALFVIDFWPLQRFSLSSKIFLEKIPYLILSLISCIITFMAQKSGHSVLSAAVHPLADRLNNALLSYASYLYKIFIPLNLSVFYPFHDIELPEIIWSALLLLIISFIAFAMRKKKPFLLAGWLWYLIVLLPVIGIIQVGEQAMADRYTYLPSLGVFLSFVWGMAEIFKKHKFPSVGAALLSSGLLLSCLIIARQQTSFWKDQATLFRHAIQVTEKNYWAHFHLGNALLKMNKISEAQQQFKLSLEIIPTARANNNLAYAMEKSGDTNGAIKYYRAAIELEPSSVEANFNLGLLLLKNWNLNEAVIRFKSVLAVDQENSLAKSNLLRAQRMLASNRQKNSNR